MVKARVELSNAWLRVMKSWYIVKPAKAGLMSRDKSNDDTSLGAIGPRKQVDDDCVEKIHTPRLPTGTQKTQPSRLWLLLRVLSGVRKISLPGHSVTLGREQSKYYRDRAVPQENPANRVVSGIDNIDISIFVTIMRQVISGHFCQFRVWLCRIL